MELKVLQNAVLNRMSEKLCTDDLSKFGLEYHLKRNKLLFAIDRYYFVAVKKKDERFYLKSKTLGMKLESEWFLVLDDDRII